MTYVSTKNRLKYIRCSEDEYEQAKAGKFDVQRAAKDPSQAAEADTRELGDVLEALRRQLREIALDALEALPAATSRALGTAAAASDD